MIVKLKHVLVYVHFQGKIRSRGRYTDLANAGIDLVSLLSSKDSNNDDDDDNDSAIDEDSEPAQILHVHDVILRRGTGAKGLKAVNRWSTTSSIDIEADFEAMASKVLTPFVLINCTCEVQCLLVYTSLTYS